MHAESTILLTRQAANLAEVPLATDSKKGISAVADFLERIPDVTGVLIVDRQNRQLEARGSIGQTGLRMIDSDPLGILFERDDHLIYVTAAVYLNTMNTAPSSQADTTSSVIAEKIGYVAIAASRDSEYANIKRIWTTGTVIIIASGLLSVLLASWAAASVARPMVALSQALKRVAGGDLSTNLSEQGNSEFSRVNADFNRMTQSLDISQKGLQDEIELATHQLANRTREAEAASNAKTRFLAAASHDLRQPAHALSLYTATFMRLIKQQSSNPSGNHVQALESVGYGLQAASSSLDSLLNAVLDVSRLDAGVVQINLQNTALKPLIHEVVTVFASQAAQRALELNQHVRDLNVLADPSLLRRILDNLVSNALKFSTKGAVLISVRKRENYALIQVWDQGIGIAQEQLPLVFEEFYRIKQSAAHDIPGMGLGLAIVARAAKLMNATIDVRSKLNHGTCFSLLVPLVALAPGDDAASNQDIQPSTDVNSHAHQRIEKREERIVLVLDDEMMVRDATSVYLQSLGIDSRTAPNREKLIYYARWHRERIIGAIIDYRLQDSYTGVETARTLRGILWPETPIIIITGDTSPEHLLELEKSGFEVQHKPLDHAKLLKSLKL